MTDGKNGSAKNSASSTKRTMLIAGVVIAALVLVAVGIGAVVAVNRAGGPSGAVAPPEGGGPSTTTRPIPATGSSATSITSTATTDTGQGRATAGSSTPTTSRNAPKPSKSVLDALNTGQWQLYGAQAIAPGVELKRSDGIDVQGIQIECEALAKSGSGYAHATVELSLSASGPASGKSGSWKLFGTWVLTPDDGTKKSQHYGQGIEGALAGNSSVRPPTRSGKVQAGFSPIGAYRPKASGLIKSGSFSGNAMFEGVLDLPSLPTPPPSKF